VTKVFIGGSRRIRRLPGKVRERLERIIEKRFPVLIGDANGADRAVQEYLSDRGYDRVQVFCMEGICRNNIGGWNTRIILAPKGAKGAGYYSVKDEEMTKESTIGLMLWDGNSKGTLANISRLLDQGKKVVVYIAAQHDFVTLTGKDAWKSFLSQSKTESPRRGRTHAALYDRHITT
jgi:hypothetical protein